MGIRPKKGRRVVWVTYDKDPGSGSFAKITHVGIVIGRIEKLSRASASESRVYYNIKGDNGIVRRVEPWQLERYADEGESEK